MKFTDAVKEVYDGAAPETIALFMLGDYSRNVQDLRDGVEEYAIEMDAAKHQCPRNWKRSF